MHACCMQWYFVDLCSHICQILTIYMLVILVSSNLQFVHHAMIIRVYAANVDSTYHTLPLKFKINNVFSLRLITFLQGKYAVYAFCLCLVCSLFLLPPFSRCCYQYTSVLSSCQIETIVDLFSAMGLWQHNITVVEYMLQFRIVNTLFFYWTLSEPDNRSIYWDHVLAVSLRSWDLTTLPLWVQDSSLDQRD